MNFELLPNEILIECFDYLNGLDIINAFDGLNYRFQMLIENISLKINLEMINKTTFDRFCHKMLLNPSLKQKIYSLKLSNSHTTCKQIQRFLFLFSLDQFPDLQALSITDLDFKEFQTIPTVLPMATYLRHVSFNHGPVKVDDILTSLSPSKIQRLSIPVLYDVPSIEKFRLITHLTIDQYCSLKILFDFVKSTPILKYLQVENLSADDDETIDNSTQAICLTTLILKIKCRQKFSHLEMLLKKTPNLEKFILFTEHTEEVFDASRWQYFISSSLIHLKIFKFKFFFEFQRYYNPTISTKEEFFNKFQQFQNDFWHNEHDWYTVCILDDDHAVISTIPYYSNELTLMSNTMISSKRLINNTNLFKKVTDLKLNEESMENLSNYYFSNVKSLTLSISILNIRDFESIKMNINLFNLNSISFEENHPIPPSSIILNILKESPNLSSINIPKKMLFSFFNHYEICQYLKKMIKKLTIKGKLMDRDADQIIYSNKLRRVCRIFSNLETFQCRIKVWDDLTFLLSQLPKLSHLTITTSLSLPDNIDIFLEQIQLKLNKIFLYNYFKGPSINKLHIWSGDHIN